MGSSTFRRLAASVAVLAPLVLAGCFEVVLRELDPSTVEDDRTGDGTSPLRPDEQDRPDAAGASDEPPDADVLARADAADVARDSGGSIPGEEPWRPSRPHRPDPLPDLSPCIEEIECQPGSLCLYQSFDCSAEVRGTCIHADFCETWLIPFCACDGTTFVAPGNCIPFAHAHAGACRP